MGRVKAADIPHHDGAFRRFPLRDMPPRLRGPWLPSDQGRPSSTKAVRFLGDSARSTRAESAHAATIGRNKTVSPYFVDRGLQRGTLRFAYPGYKILCTYLAVLSYYRQCCNSRDADEYDRVLNNNRLPRMHDDVGVCDHRGK